MGAAMIAILRLPRAFAFLLLCWSAMLAACGGGFQAARPDPEQIISITNQNLAVPESIFEPIIPKELPILPGPGPAIEPFVQPPADTAPISPRGLGSAPSIAPLGTPEPVDINTPPYTALGRLEFTEGSQPKYCSAELVGNTGDVIMTAGHCVYDNNANRWNTSLRFKLHYSNGSSPQIFDWQCTAVFTGWPQKLYRKDYAFIKLRGNAAAAMGLRVGLPVSQWTSVGYPSNYASGLNAHRVSGNRGRVSAGTVEMTGNPFGGGSSGGAWLDGNFAIGLNSFKYDSQPNSMWGPLFDGQTTRLYEFVRRGCQSDVIPLGSDPLIAQYDKKSVYIEIASKVVDYGPQLKKRQSQRCPCQGSEEIYLENTTRDAYESEIAYSAVTGSEALTILTSDKMSMRVNSTGTEVLGCTFGNETGGNSCPVSMNFIVTQSRRLLDINQAGRTSRVPVSPEFCADQCINNLGGGYCLPFGNAAKPIIVPLAGFVTESLDRPPQANGVTTTVKELVTAFQGDPNAEDPCQRSDFYKKQDDVTNHGIACITTTPPIVDLPDEARISLRSPSVGSARRLTVTGATGSVANFSERNVSPALEFYGANSDEINRRFGGYVVNLERRAGRLIITTEHGCSVGDVP
jgi:hypothetical protein